MVQALAPAHIIEGGLPTERLAAYITVSKYADGLPLYRQEATICVMASRSADR
ncbi:transposase [Sinorhizobium sp. 8-89]|uniref:IS66 family transposase n=1 Tax=Sinorhizobium sp. 8-89 TaxID=3049089 RepID=UPI00386D7DE3